MENTIKEINNCFDIYRIKDEYYPLYLVPTKNDLSKNVIEITHITTEDGKDIVEYKETKIKKQCFVLTKYTKIKAENINDGSIVTCISAIIQTYIKMNNQQ